MKSLTPYLLALLAFAVTAVVVGPVLFGVVLILAGPHSGLLPAALRGAVLILAWLALAIVPTVVALRVYRRRRQSR
jgi:hypothetical protein